MLKVKKFKGKGRGIVAIKSISKGTLIESAPASAFPAEERKVIDKTEISKYYFVKPTEYESANEDVKGYLVFGLSSLCNHAEHPNAKVEWRKDDVGLWADLIALQDILADEEVTVFYTNIDEYSLKTFI